VAAQRQVREERRDDARRQQVLVRRRRVVTAALAGDGVKQRAAVHAIDAAWNLTAAGWAVGIRGVAHDWRRVLADRLVACTGQQSPGELPSAALHARRRGLVQQQPR
jgi:hypothetical protein